MEDTLNKLQEAELKVKELEVLQAKCNEHTKVIDHFTSQLKAAEEKLLDLAALQKASSEGKSEIENIRQELEAAEKQIKSLESEKDAESGKNPTDVSYVYSGYAPLGVRLAQLLSRPGWRSIEEVLRILPGPHFEERQPLPTGLQKKRQPGENRVTLIFFLGGVTFAEIAALRFLSQLEDGGTEYVIATTKLINGASWIESLMEKPF